LTFSDLALARRLERAEGRASADWVEARALAYPERGAQWIQVGGALAMFDGAESPLTQTFALGLDGAVSPTEFERLEQFFNERQAAVHHEVSPLADAAVFSLLYERHYQVVEFTNVMWQPITRAGASITASALPAADIAVREIGRSEHDVWARTAAQGWSHLPELTAFLHELAAVNVHRRNHVSFLGEMNSEPIAAASLAMRDGVALLAGASTIPSARKRGAQLALLEARLRYAAAEGCDIAMMGAVPGSDSQRNAERQGFRIAYTRIKWKLKLPAA
jgi:hypothetical protein